MKLFSPVFSHLIFESKRAKLFFSACLALVTPPLKAFGLAQFLLLPCVTPLAAFPDICHISRDH